MDKIRDKIQSWPRWVRYGLVSGTTALIRHLFNYVVSPISCINLISFGTLAPFYWFEVLTGIGRLPELIELGITLGFWSLLGGLLGKLTDKLGYAVLIWCVIQIIMGYCTFVYLLATQ